MLIDLKVRNKKYSLFSNIFPIFLANEQLKSFILTLNYEQQKLCSEAANTSLSTIRMYQRLTILKRYFIALNRTPYTSDYDTSYNKLKRHVRKNANVIGKPRNDLNIMDPKVGLACVGSRIGLSFSFAFLRKAWRLG